MPYLVFHVIVFFRSVANGNKKKLSAISINVLCTWAMTGAHIREEILFSAHENFVLGVFCLGGYFVQGNYIPRGLY